MIEAGWKQILDLLPRKQKESAANVHADQIRGRDHRRGCAAGKGKGRLRVAASGFPETIELRRTGSRWITAGHVQVEFDFLMSDEHQAESVYSSTAIGAAMVD